MQSVAKWRAAANLTSPLMATHASSAVLCFASSSRGTRLSDFGRWVPRLTVSFLKHFCAVYYEYDAVVGCDARNTEKKRIRAHNHMSNRAHPDGLRVTLLRKNFPVGGTRIAYGIAAVPANTHNKLLNMVIM